MLIFAPQNLIKDPPFTKLDLFSCRNLLIYLGPELQKRIFPVFHYSLKDVLASKVRKVLDQANKEMMG